jgi:DNA/RNA non-specific endonuclease
MAATRFNGPSEQINYFPQSPATNRYQGWSNFEKEIENLRKANPNDVIKVEIIPTFPGTSKRPNEFNVSCKRGLTIIFENRIIENP